MSEVNNRLSKFSNETTSFLLLWGLNETAELVFDINFNLIPLVPDTKEQTDGQQSDINYYLSNVLGKFIRT